MLGSWRHEFSPASLAALLASLLVSVALLAPVGAAAATTADGALTPELEELSTPALAEASPEAQAEALGVPAEGPGSLSREGERLIVEAHFEGGALARLEALKEAGAKVLVADPRYQTVALSVEPEDLDAVAAVPGISSVVPARRPVVYATEGGATTAAGGASSLCEGGSVISKGYEQLNVKTAREAFGTRGKGVTVGVLSNSFDAAAGSTGTTDAAADEATDDLPGPKNSCTGQQVPVNVIAEAPPPGPNEEELDDEGRAMLQVVHDLAPHAGLAFATAYGSEIEFARNIEKLAEPVSKGGAGATVIVDDVAYYTEPFFQEGPVADAIRRVTANGVTYLTAAGNDNLFEGSPKTGREIGSWERAQYADTTCPLSLATWVQGATGSCLNFSGTGNDNTFGITVKGKATLILDLQWAEPWYGVKSDLDAYLLKKANNELLYAYPVENLSEGGGEPGEEFSAPNELIGWENKSKEPVEVNLVVDRCINLCNPAASRTALPRVKIGLLENGSGGVTKIPPSESEPGAGITVGPTVFGHAGSTAAITVGAINVGESGAHPVEPEYYSSRGPVTDYFGPVEGTTPAKPLPTPEVVHKPDITATDCAATTFFAEPSGVFCGTSEAAPHAAAVAALMKQIDPLVSPESILGVMQETATRFARVTSEDAVGAGLLNAAGAMTALGAQPVANDPPSEWTAPIEEPQGGGGRSKGGSGTGGGGENPEESPVIPTPTPSPTPPAAPVVRVTKGPPADGNDPRPTFEFSASRPARFACQIDGAAPQPCSSPYTAPRPLDDGTHGFAVIATAEGRSGTSPVYYFTVDTQAPKARIVAHPAKLVKTRRATFTGRFRLTSNQSSVTYYCRFDREPLRICGARVAHRFKPGRHVLKVKARDELGNVSAGASTFRFRVRKLRR